VSVNERTESNANEVAAGPADNVADEEQPHHEIDSPRVTAT